MGVTLFFILLSSPLVLTPKFLYIFLFEGAAFKLLTFWTLPYKSDNFYSNSTPSLCFLRYSLNNSSSISRISCYFFSKANRASSFRISTNSINLWAIKRVGYIGNSKAFFLFDRFEVFSETPGELVFPKFQNYPGFFLGWIKEGIGDWSLVSASLTYFKSNGNSVGLLLNSPSELLFKSSTDVVDPSQSDSLSLEEWFTISSSADSNALPSLTRLMAKSAIFLLRLLTRFFFLVSISHYSKIFVSLTWQMSFLTPYWTSPNSYLSRNSLALRLVRGSWICF